MPIFERQAAGVYRNSAAVIDADGSLLGVYRKMHIPDDPLFNEKYYFTPDGDHASPGLPGLAHALRDDRRADLLGSVVSGGRAHHQPARRAVLFYPTAIGWHPSEKDEWGAAQVDAWRTIQRSHAIANGVYVAAANRIGHEDEPGTDGLEFFGHSFIADPFGRYVAEAGERRRRF